MAIVDGEIEGEGVVADGGAGRGEGGVWEEALERNTVGPLVS